MTALSQTALADIGPAEFQTLAQTYDIIPLCLEVEADLETPITAFWKLRDGATSFLFESVEGGETWARYTFMGTNPKRTFIARGNNLTVVEKDGTRTELDSDEPLASIHAHIASTKVFKPRGLPRFYGGLVGAVSYDSVAQWVDVGDAPEARVPDFYFFETDLILAWDNLKHKALLIHLARPGDCASVDTAYTLGQSLLREAKDRITRPLPPFPTATNEPQTVRVSVPDAEFEQRVAAAKTYIEAGDVIQVVLSREFNQEGAGLHPFLVYRTLRSLNPSPYMFYLETPDLCLVGASPEVLVRNTSELVEVRPIAGTRRRGKTPTEDLAMEHELRSDPKEIAEHVMLVDLARNDIGRIAATGSVQVKEQMVVERYSHVMHLVSHVCGRLDPKVSVPELLRATFPAGTLSGAPKRRAMQVIRELENEARGHYGGAVGVLGPDGDLDLCIAIRMMTAQEGAFSVRAGAGVVFDSVPAHEAVETTNKARALLVAIDRARERFGGSPT
jgi:anthranilate synthase component I